MAKVKIDSDLLDRAKVAAASAGYSSVEEFIAHLLEKDLAQQGTDKSEEEVAKRLRGLGYIG